MNAYYNENDPFAAEWLRGLIREGLITPGYVDERDIRDVQPSDLEGYTRHHFFAGIGGWDYALQLAGWPADRSVWTGSCPCQPHSSAARGHHVAEDLWPEWRRLIVACRPAFIFGEQVDEARAWLDGVCDDMEALDYSIRATVLPAYCVGQDHARERIYFAGHPNRDGKSGSAVNAETPWLSRARGHTGGMGPPNGISPRVAQLRAYGNAIVPQVAAEFILAWREAVGQ